MELYLNCLKCSARKRVREDERVEKPNFKWRCRNCGAGWKCAFLHENESSGLTTLHLKEIKIIDDEVINDL